MSRLNVRRLTTGLLLAALLGLAAPAAAAPPDWSRATVALGPAWVDQVLEWLRSLLPGDGREGQGTREKNGGSAPSGTADDGRGPGQTPAPESDLSSTADPNG